MRHWTPATLTFRLSGNDLRHPNPALPCGDAEGLKNRTATSLRNRSELWMGGCARGGCEGYRGLVLLGVRSFLALGNVLGIPDMRGLGFSAGLGFTGFGMFELA